jgi:Trk K+ transport system NAD-binding subunit
MSKPASLASGVPGSLVGGYASDDREPNMYTVIVGYGAIGRSTARMLPDHSAGLIVVDRNADRTLLASQDGMPVVRGDGGDIVTLRAAHLPDAACVVVVVSDDPTAVRITTAARSLNPAVTIITVIRDPGRRQVAHHAGG